MSTEIIEADRSLWYLDKTMISSREEQPGSVQESRKNGNGYMSYIPESPTPADQILPERGLCDPVRFTELPDVVRYAANEGSVLLEGQPGAGKSNITQDIERCARSVGVPILRFTMHINAGTTRNIENTIGLIDEFRSYAKECSGFFVLDNADYGGYRGSSRTRKNAYEYAESVLPAMTEAVNDDRLLVIGTAHDEKWRECKWTWDDPLIQRHANELLESFSARYEFLGTMTEQGVVDLLRHREADQATAEKAASHLGSLGLLSFFYGNHIDYDKLQEDPGAALAEVKHGRKIRYSTNSSHHSS